MVYFTHNNLLAKGCLTPFEVGNEYAHALAKVNCACIFEVTQYLLRPTWSTIHFQLRKLEDGYIYMNEIKYASCNSFFSICAPKEFNIFIFIEDGMSWILYATRHFVKFNDVGTQVTHFLEPYFDSLSTPE